MVLLISSFCLASTPSSISLFNVVFLNSSCDDTHGSISAAIATDIEFVQVPEMFNGNGIGAYFNGSTSSIAYGLGADNELKIEGSLTYHARVRFDKLENAEQFIMGRFGKNNSSATPNRVAYLQHYFTKGELTGRLSVDGIASYGHSIPLGVIKTGVFYDVFFVFRQKVGTVNGFFKTLVVNAETGFIAAESDIWLTGITSLYNDSAVPFWVGYRGSHSSVIPFNGVIEQVNVWNYALSDVEIEEFCGFGELVCGHPGLPYLPEDLNRDCYVNLDDLLVLAGNWLSVN